MKFLRNIFLAVLVLGSIQCNKNEETVKYADVKITVLNMTLGDSTSNFSRSYGFDQEGINTGTDFRDYEYYLLTSNPNSGDESIEFVARNYKLLFTDEDFDYIRKYEFGEVIDANNETANQSNQSVEGWVLSDSRTTEFKLNSTQYIGICYGGKEGYHGWIKIKTLNNYYSCIIEAYAVATEAGLPIKIDY